MVADSDAERIQSVHRMDSGLGLTEYCCHFQPMRYFELFHERVQATLVSIIQFHCSFLSFDPAKLATCNQGSHEGCEGSRTKLNTLFFGGRHSNFPVGNGILSCDFLVDCIGTLLHKRYAPFEFYVRGCAPQYREERNPDRLAVFVGSFGQFLAEPI